MSLLDEIQIRRLRGPDCHVVARLISKLQKERQQEELRKQIKRLFLHPSMWVMSALIIFLVGRSLDFPPILTSCAMLPIIWLWYLTKFRKFWTCARRIFKTEGEDWQNLYKVYCLSRRKRLFLVAELGNHIVGTIAVQEIPGVPETSRTCKAWRYFVSQDWRRNGIGTKLLEDACRLSSELGYSKMSMQVTADSPAEQTLLKNGFSFVGSDTIASSYPLSLLKLIYEKSDLEIRESEENIDEDFAKKDV